MISSIEKQPSHRLWVWLLLAILLGMLYVGLRPKAYDFMNHVAWIEGKFGHTF